VLSVYLGTLGMTGMIAWVWLNLVEVKADDIKFISAATGAVGSVAGANSFIARVSGHRVCRFN